MTLDTATAALVAKLRSRGLPPLETQTVAEARRVAPLLAKRVGPGPAVWRVQDFDLAGPPSPSVRVLRPSPEASGVIVFIHGGGWVLGDAVDIDTLGRHLAVGTGCAVALVNYRRAPEHPYPAAVDDCWKALNWVVEAAKSQSWARADFPLIVGGESAGGNLAAVLALVARDRGQPRIDLQLLVCPILDCDLDTPSYLDDDNQLMLTRSGMRWFLDQYAPVERRSEGYVSPLRAPSHAGLAPAALMIAEHDVLRSEAEKYADLLAAADVEVVSRVFAGQMHGFLSYLNILPGSVEGLAFAVQAVNARTGAEEKLP
jgi:acetyl esterase